MEPAAQSACRMGDTQTVSVRARARRLAHISAADVLVHAPPAVLVWPAGHATWGIRRCGARAHAVAVSLTSFREYVLFLKRHVTSAHQRGTSAALSKASVAGARRRAGSRGAAARAGGAAGSSGRAVRAGAAGWRRFESKENNIFPRVRTELGPCRLLCTSEGDAMKTAGRTSARRRATGRGSSSVAGCFNK